MLYDPKWEKPTLAGLMDCRGGCLFGQYMASLGIEWVEDHPRRPGETPYIRCLESMGGFDMQCIASESPRTFGAALDRARALAATA
jgi:hypothetical protein